MSGIELTDEVTTTQLEALCGGDLLKAEVVIEIADQNQLSFVTRHLETYILITIEIDPAMDSYRRLMPQKQ